MKLQNSKFKTQIISLLAGLLVFGVGVSAASAVIIPAKSVVNPLNGALYVIDNGAAADTARLVAYKKFDNMWISDTTVVNNLLAGSKCYGLAVSADGLKLYVSVEKGKDSAVWVYPLVKSTGLPTTDASAITKISGWASADSAPKGIAVDPGTGYIYVADAGLGKVHVFKNNAYSFSFGPGLSDAGLYDLAITGNKLFVSKKNSSGKIFYYSLPAANSSAAKTILTGLPIPTYLKVSPDGSRLYVAMNGASAEDIYIYYTSPLNTDPKIISNTDNITGSFGWTGFDLAPDGKTLFYTQAQDQAETATKLYKVTGLPDNPVVTYVKDVVKSDGLGVSSDQKFLAVTDSGTGLINGGAANAANGIETGLGYVTPVITSIFPASAPIDADSVTVTVYGNYFQISNGSKLPDIALCTNFSTQLFAGGIYNLSDVTVKSPTEIFGKLSQSGIKGIFGIVNDKKLAGKPLNEKLHVRVINFPTSSGIAAFLPSAFEIQDPAKAPAVESPLQQKADGNLLSAGEKTNAKVMAFSFGMSDPNFASEAYPVKLKPRVQITDINKAEKPSLYWGEPASYDGNGALFPTGTVNVSDLPEGSYTWQAGVSDEANLTSSWESYPGKALAHFIIDRTPPVVSSTNPQNNGATASLKPTIKVNFNERMDADAFTIPELSANSVIVKANGVKAACKLSYADVGHSHILTITPEADLAKDAKVEVRLVGKNAIKYYVIKDQAGNALDGNKDGTGGDDYVFSFTIDQTPPELDLKSVFPAVEAEDAALDTKVVVAFTEPMDQGSIIASAHYIGAQSKLPESVNLTLVGWSKDSKSAEFSHAHPFPANSEITIKAAHAQDLAGNPLIENSWIFFTAKKPVVKNIYPHSAPEDKNTPTTIIITGENFTLGSTAKIMDVPLTNVKYLDANKLSANVPPPASAGFGMGKYHITVAANGGASDATAADYFEITQAGLNPQGDPDQVADLKAQAVEDPVGSGSYKVALAWTNPPDLDLQSLVLLRTTTANFPTIDSSGKKDTDSIEILVATPPEPGAAMLTTDTNNIEKGKTYRYAVYAGDTSEKWNNDKLEEGRNAAKVEVGAVGPVIVPNSIKITRDGDIAKDSTVTISWKADPQNQGANVDIYILESTEFLKDTNAWKIAVADKISGPDIDGKYSWTDNFVVDPAKPDAFKVGSGTTRYYKVIPKGTSLDPGTLASDAVGKFDYILNQGTNLLSLPLIPSGGNTISQIIGTQPVGSAGDYSTADEILKYNPTKPDFYDHAWLVEGMGDPAYDNKWFDENNNEVTNTFSANPGEGFWLQVKNINTPPVTIVGKVVSDPKFTIPIAGNLNIGTNLIGHPYPVSVKIGDSGLNGPAIGSAGDYSTADEILKYNPTKPDFYDHAWLVEGMGDPAYDNKWFDENNNEITSTFSFEPGKGYWIQLKNGQYLWDYSNPLIK